LFPTIGFFPVTWQTRAMTATPIMQKWSGIMAKIPSDIKRKVARAVELAAPMFDSKRSWNRSETGC
jgi:hypothetical protein